ncbi:MAG: heme o synthase [Bacteroidia bacterium]
MSLTTKTVDNQSTTSISKFRSYMELAKFKLNLTVSISALFGYTMAAIIYGVFSWIDLLMIGLGGFLITAGANTFNQISEQEYDAKMKRTQNRPLPTKRLTNTEAILFGVFTSIAGVAILGIFFNLPTALLGVIGLLSYSFVYTPMKRYSPFSVFIGAIPGALPPLIGWVGVTQAIDKEGIILFAFQFLWQFPHFWAIAWKGDADYQKAGFKMLPTSSGKSKISAAFILFYAFCHVPIALFPYLDGMINGFQATILALLGFMFTIPAIQLYRTLEEKYALYLMFASFLYLPLMELTFLVKLFL